MERLGSLLGLPDASDSRWSSQRRAQAIKTADRLGDGLADRLWRVGDVLATSQDAAAFLETAATFIAPILKYEQEPRPFIRLAHTGLAVELVERAHRWLNLVSRESGVAESGVDKEWRDELLRERRERAAAFQRTLEDGSTVRDLVLRDEDVVEAQTLLSYGYATHSSRLLDDERLVVVATFNRLTHVSGIITVKVPTWFTSPLEIERRKEYVWRGADVGVLEASTLETEESFLNQVALWKTFNHPSIAKLFAASHIGRRRFVFTLGVEKEDGLCSWTSIYQCAQALQYVHHCGAAHRNLSRASIRFSSHKAMLLGYQVIRQPKKRTGFFAVVGGFVSKMLSTLQPEIDEELPSLETSMRTLARISIAAMEGKRGDFGEHAHFVPTQTLGKAQRPKFLTSLEWSALQAMASLASSDQTALQYVNLQLEALVDSGDDSYIEHSSSDSAQLLRDTIALAATSQSFQEVFDEMEKFFASGIHKATASMDHTVYERLTDVYKQICERRCSALPNSLVTKFRAVVARYFHSTVTSSALSYSSVIASLAVRSLAGPDYSYHREIDKLLGFRDVNDSDRVHNSHRGRSSSIDDEDDVPTSRFNNFTFSSSSALPNTITKRRVNRDSNLDAVNELYESGSMAIRNTTKRSPSRSRRQQNRVIEHLPVWYIQPHEVELGDFIAQGSFGAVYRGKWYNTEVVIKMIIGHMNVEQRQAFKHEADIWYKLEHPNIIQLYGACHTGSRSFFVCELAEGGTLTEYLQQARPYLWRCIREAAVGLQYLHDRSVIHSDLKGNNILVGADFSVKLADFGLSQLDSQYDGLEQSSAEIENAGALGAYRWKAPEILNGGRPTSASDVFSFAMCIIECVSGEVPWGTTIPDLVVKVNVKRGRLPARPNGFRDDEWELITRMLCLYPSDRVSMRLVVETLNQFRERESLPP